MAAVTTYLSQQVYQDTMDDMAKELEDDRTKAEEDSDEDTRAQLRRRKLQKKLSRKKPHQHQYQHQLAHQQQEQHQQHQRQAEVVLRPILRPPMQTKTKRDPKKAETKVDAWFESLQLDKSFAVKRTDTRDSFGGKGKSRVQYSSLMLRPGSVWDRFMGRVTAVDRALPIFHPRKPFRTSWDIFIMTFVIFNAVTVPLYISYGLPAKAGLEIFNYCVDLLFAIDICFNFRTAYIDKQGQLIRDSDKIAKNYLKFWFPIDFFATVPYDLIAKGMGYGDSEEQLTILQFLKTPRLLRLGKLIRMLDRVKNANMFKVINLIAAMAMIAHWLACIWYMLYKFTSFAPSLDDWAFNPGYNEKSITFYVSAYYQCFLMLVGNNQDPINNAERVLFITIGVLGTCFYSAVVGQMAVLVANMNPVAMRHRQRQDMTMDVLRYIGCPEKDKERVQYYFEYISKFTHPSNEGLHFITDLPKALLQEVAGFLYREKLANVPIFEGLEAAFLTSVSMKMKIVSFTPKEVIFRAGDLGAEMYIIRKGHVAVVGKHDQLMSILGPGDHFGEIALLTQARRTAKCVALSNIDLCILNSFDLKTVMKDFPSNAATLEANAAARLKTLQVAGRGGFVESEDESDESSQYSSASHGDSGDGDGPYMPIDGSDPKQDGSYRGGEDAPDEVPARPPVTQASLSTSLQRSVSIAPRKARAAEDLIARGDKLLQGRSPRTAIVGHSEQGAELDTAGTAGLAPFPPSKQPPQSAATQSTAATAASTTTRATATADLLSELASEFSMLAKDTGGAVDLEPKGPSKDQLAGRDSLEFRLAELSAFDAGRSRGPSISQVSSGTMRSNPTFDSRARAGSPAGRTVAGRTGPSGIAEGVEDSWESSRDPRAVQRPGVVLRPPPLPRISGLLPRPAPVAEARTGERHGSDLSSDDTAFNKEQLKNSTDRALRASFDASPSRAPPGLPQHGPDTGHRISVQHHDLRPSREVSRLSPLASTPVVLPKMSPQPKATVLDPMPDTSTQWMRSAINMSRKGRRTSVLMAAPVMQEMMQSLSTRTIQNSSLYELSEAPRAGRYHERSSATGRPSPGPAPAALPHVRGSTDVRTSATRRTSATMCTSATRSLVAEVHGSGNMRGSAVVPGSGSTRGSANGPNGSERSTGHRRMSQVEMAAMHAVQAQDAEVNKQVAVKMHLLLEVLESLSAKVDSLESRLVETTAQVSRLECAHELNQGGGLGILNAAAAAALTSHTEVEIARGAMAAKGQALNKQSSRKELKSGPAAAN